MSASPVGKTFDLEYYRDGQRHTATIVPAPAENVVFDLEREQAARARVATRRSRPRRPISDFGLEVQPLTPELAKTLDLPAGAKGLLVSQVKEGSAADAEGIKEGDVITKVVRDRRIQPLTSVKEFQDLAAKSDELSFYVQSGKGPGRFVTLSKAKK